MSFLDLLLTPDQEHQKVLHKVSIIFADERKV